MRLVLKFVYSCLFLRIPKIPQTYRSLKTKQLLPNERNIYRHHIDLKTATDVKPVSYYLFYSPI